MSQELIQQAHFEEQPDGTVIPVDPSEKAQQEQPAQEAAIVQKRVRYESGDYSAWVEIPMSEANNKYRECVEIRKIYTHPAPTQPALSESVIEELAVKHEAFGFGRVDAKGFTTHGFDPDGLLAFAKELIEAHCRGGANG